MAIEDIIPKQDSDYALDIIRRLGIEPKYYLSAEDINTIVEAIKNNEPGGDVNLDGFVKDMKYNESNDTISFMIEGEATERVVSLVPQDLKGTVEDLDFDETTAKPYEKYITHST